MEQINYPYISLEEALLLESKIIIIKTFTYCYRINNNHIFSIHEPISWYKSDHFINIPTYFEVFDWFRINKGIHVEIHTIYDDEHDKVVDKQVVGYNCKVYSNALEMIEFELDQISKENFTFYLTYEDACKAAVAQLLNKL